MPRGQTKQRDASLNTDPRIRDPVIWNRIKLMVENEACDRAWGCGLYMLNRTGGITNEQREAGDRYYRIIEDFRRTQQIDPSELNLKEREFQLGRIMRAKRLREDVVELLGTGRTLLDDLILSEIYPCSERQKKLIRAMLEVLSRFFSQGKKKKRLSMV